MQKEFQIEGLATFTPDGFRFDSGMPSNEPFLEQEKNLRGELKIFQNGCVDFKKSTQVYLPPQMEQVARGKDYLVRRSSRHYIIQVKVPIVENRHQSEDKLQQIIPCIMGDITMDRSEVLGNALMD